MKEFVVRKGTFVKTEQNASKVALYHCFVLVFFIIFAIVKNGLVLYIQKEVALSVLLFPILFILTALITALLSDLIYQQIFKLSKRANYIESINIGILLVLILPMYTPLYMVVLGVVVSITFKYMMLKIKRPIYLTPTLVGWAVIMAAYLFHLLPTIDYLNPLEVDLGTPLGRLSGLTTLGSYSYLVKPYGSLFDFLIGLVPGGLGTTCIILCIAAFIYLTYNRVLKWRIPLVTIATVFFTTMMIGGVSGFTVWYPLFHICSGALIFGSIFLAGDFNSSPVTPIGQILYGLFLGILIVALRFFTPLVDGSLVAMLMIPVIKNFCDYIGATSRFYFNRSIIVFVVAWLLILFLGLFLGIHYKNIDQKIEISYLSKV